MTRNAIIVGASGLVGSQLLKALLDSPNYSSITALLRRPVDFQHPKLTQCSVDFDRLDERDFPHADDVFCCLGTTIKVAGSKAAFYRVDFTYVHEVARLALAAGAQQFLLVSSMGADPRSPFFYIRVKGEIEAALKQMPYPSTSVFRPSFLSGERKPPRPWETLGGSLLQAVSFMVPRKYRPVPARAVALAMLDQANSNRAGFHVIESDLLLGYA